MFEYITVDSGLVGLRAGDNFLCAEPGEGIALNRPQCMEWEHFWLLPNAETIATLHHNVDTAVPAGRRLEVLAPFVVFPDVVHAVRELITSGPYEQSLRLIMKIVGANCPAPGYHGRALYFREFDVALKKLSDRLCNASDCIFRDGFCTRLRWL
jgi:hypothetical protein